MILCMIWYHLYNLKNLKNLQLYKKYHSPMGVFHVFKIAQMVPNHTKRLRTRLLGTRPPIGNFVLILLMASFCSTVSDVWWYRSSLISYIKEALSMRLMLLINTRDKPLIINLFFKTCHQIKTNRNLASYLPCMAGTSQQVVTRLKSITNTAD